MIEQETTFSGMEIPDEIEFRTSVTDPVFSGFVTVRHGSFTPPDFVTIAKLSSLDKDHSAGGGSSLRGANAINKDTGANIFKEARFGVVGDWQKVLPAFIEQLLELLD